MKYFCPEIFEGKDYVFDRIDRLNPKGISDFLEVAPDFKQFLTYEQGSTLLESAENLRNHAARGVAAGLSSAYFASDKVGCHLIGSVVFNHPQIRPELINFAYYVMPSMRGRGLASYMAHDALQCFFAKSGCTQVHCAIWGDNKASLRTLEKLGFSYDGYKKSYIDPPPVMDHQFSLTARSLSPADRRPGEIRLDPET